MEMAEEILRTVEQFYVLVPYKLRFGRTRIMQWVESREKVA